MHGCGIVEVDLSFDNDQLFAATYAPAILYIICGVPSICLSVSSGRGSSSLLVWEWLTHRGVTGKSFPPSPHTNSSTLLYKWNMTLEPVKDSLFSVMCCIFGRNGFIFSGWLQCIQQKESARTTGLSGLEQTRANLNILCSVQKERAH